MDSNNGTKASTCGGIVLNSHDDTSKDSAHGISQTESRQAAGHRPSNISSRKAGRPRMPSYVTQADNAKERRRRQIRLAQRAYRSRNIANTQALRHHLAHLQAGIQDISDAAILFSDLIMQSGVLTTHPEITGPLREMLHKCMGLAKGVEAGCNQEDTHSDAAGASQPFPPDSSPLENTQPSVGEVMCPSLSIESFQALAGGKYRLQFPSSWPEVGTSNSGEVEMSSFTQYLRVACLYNALALLKDTSATIEDLRRPLRLLLSLATRETIISIFEASLKARLRGQEPEKFQELSVFQQDGTESHCKRNSSQSQIQRSHRTDCTVERPPFHSYSKDQDGEGRWFDIQDLEEHLREKNVSLCLFAPSGPNVNSSPCIINTLTLIAELAKKAICLGHSPGFESHDVELALYLASSGPAQRD